MTIPSTGTMLDESLNDEDDRYAEFVKVVFRVRTQLRHLIDEKVNLLDPEVATETVVLYWNAQGCYLHLLSMGLTERDAVRALLG